MAITTDPASIQQGSTATYSWDVDFSSQLSGAETLSSPSCTLERIAGPASLTMGTFLSPAPTCSVVGSAVRVTLTGLEKGYTYRMVTKATVAIDKIPTAATTVTVPF